jgi:hypothetical protein
LLEVESPEGTVVPGALLRLASGQRRQANMSGQVMLEHLPVGRLLLQLDAPGFVSTPVAFELSRRVQAGARLRMMPLGPPVAVFNTRDGLDSTRVEGWPYPDIHITVAADSDPDVKSSLFDEEGRPIEGEVELYFAPVALEAGGLLSAPGVQQGVILPGTEPVNLESLAMMTLLFRKKEQGGSPQEREPGDVSVFARRLGLRGGVPRSVRANSEQRPGGIHSLSGGISTQVDLLQQRVPIWRWDPTLGYWVPMGEEGIITEHEPGKLEWNINMDSAPPLLNMALPFYWRLSQADPSNPLRVPVDAWKQTACLEVLVLADGKPVKGRMVAAHGVDYVSLSRAVTDERGLARLEVMTGKKAWVDAGDGPKEVTVSVPGPCKGPHAVGAPTRETLRVPAPLCAPGEGIDCPYSGSFLVLGKGACRAAQRLCNAYGTARSATCEGEVLAQQERCDNAQDDDCDGVVNQGCARQCEEGRTRPCYTGPRGSRGVGQCAAGMQTCVAGGTAWSACEGQVLPEELEDCLRPGDEDCDGVQCECWPLEAQPCYSGQAGTASIGECRAGVRACGLLDVRTGNSWGLCEMEITPQEESCVLDALDADCDGQLNDNPVCVCAPGTSQSCYTGRAGTRGVGVCVAGTETCNATGTQWGACTGEVTPQQELCSTVGDDDCDGEINNSPPCTWSVTGPMVSRRSNHTATLLGTGKVLVTGGEDGSGVLSSAELYDPVTNTWSSAGAMASARSNHTATLLSTGKVLVTGGYSGSAYLNSAELYDPGSNSWTPAGTMNSSRRFHAATLLGTGNVLITGGYSGSALASAELYNAGSNSWTSAGTMASARYSHAVALSGSKVLVTGGSTGNSTLSAAEVYDVAGNSWASAGTMAVPRSNHTATPLSTGEVLIAGGYNSGGYLGSAEVYDVGGNTWASAGTMAAPRSSHTATLLSGDRVLVTGGFSGGSLQTAEVYEASGTWSSAGAMALPRHNHAAALLSSGKVLVTGGSSSGIMLDTAEVYAP